MNVLVMKYVMDSRVLLVLSLRLPIIAWIEHFFNCDLVSCLDLSACKLFDCDNDDVCVRAGEPEGGHLLFLNDYFKAAVDFHVCCLFSNIVCAIVVDSW